MLITGTNKDSLFSYSSHTLRYRCPECLRLLRMDPSSFTDSIGTGAPVGTPTNIRWFSSLRLAFFGDPLLGCRVRRRERLLEAGYVLF